MTIFDPTIDHPANSPPRSPPGQNVTLRLSAEDAFFEEKRGVFLRVDATGEFEVRIECMWVRIQAVADGHRVYSTNRSKFQVISFPAFKFIPLTPNHRLHIKVRPEDIIGRRGPPSNTVSIGIYGLTYATTAAILVRNNEHRCPPPVPPLLTFRSPDAVFPPKLRLELNPTSQDNRGICLLWDVTEAPQMDIKCIYVFYCIKTADSYAIRIWRRIRSRPHTSFPGFVELKGLRGYFSATAEDVDGKCGPFSDPVEFDPF